MVGSEDGVEGDGVLRHLNSALLAVRICLIVLGFFIDCDKLELFHTNCLCRPHHSFVTALCMSFKECWLLTPDYQKVYQSICRVLFISIESSC